MDTLSNHVCLIKEIISEVDKSTSNAYIKRLCGVPVLKFSKEYII